MDRPQVHNALHPQLLQDLSTAFSDVHQEKRVSAVVLTGAGENFCAGLDLHVLSQIAEMPEVDALTEWLTAWRNFSELLEQMLRFPKPIVAAVDGAAVGAGFGLALAADMILPTSKAEFSAPAVRRGLVGGATAALLSFRAGAATAARLLLTGAPIDCLETYRLGLTMAPVPVDQIWVAASELATQCTHAPREAIQATKRVLNEGIGETLLTQLATGAADSATACTTESAVDGIRSFLEKRDVEN